MPSDDTSDEEKEFVFGEDWTLPEVIAISLSPSGRKCCFLINAPCSSLYLATCSLDSHWLSVSTKKYVV